jgi:exonuclease III
MAEDDAAKAEPSPVRTTTIKIATLNIRSLQNKFLAVASLLQNADPDIMVLTETKLKTETQVNFPGYNAFRTLPDTKGGVVILIRQNINSRLHNIYGSSQLSV